MSVDETGTFTDVGALLDGSKPLYGLLVARAPKDALRVDRYPLYDSVAFGRGEQADIRLLDQKASRNHFRITPSNDSAFVEDLGSKNGTFINGIQIDHPTKLGPQDLIRAGRTLFVFHKDARQLLMAKPVDTHGLVGPFHARVLMHELKKAIGSGRSLLLCGPSGCGKELCAQAVGAITGKALQVQNAARFSSEAEAKSSLFGVGPKVFSDVKERQGHISQADGGILFLDEAHQLPEPVQKSLLRVIEDQRLARIGETVDRRVDVRFVLASNEPGPTYGLAGDLLARLRVVEVPGLEDRRGDIPAIFDHLLQREFARADITGVKLEEILSIVHYEALILDGFEQDNVRGLYDLAERIASYVGAGADPADAVADVFARRFSTYHRATTDEFSDVVGRATGEIELPEAWSKLERDAIELAYVKHDGNVKAMRDHLRGRGMEISRKRIAKILDELGLPRIRRGRAPR